MSDTNKLVWAAEASEQHRLAPSADKILTGWGVENPPHEYFNWWMNRVDERLLNLEVPVLNTHRRWCIAQRTGIIRAGERFDLPAAYIVGGKHLKVYLDGLLCEPGESGQYIECGEEGAESTYIRFNDDIDIEYEIRIEIPNRAVEPIRHADDELVALVHELKNRVASLEQPMYCTMADSPANTRAATVLHNTIYTLPQEYVVGTNQLQVYLDGILQYAGIGYNEVGAPGSRSTDIVFTSDITPSVNIRVYISQRNNNGYVAVSENALSRYRFKEVRQDINVTTRIEAMTELTVPQYFVQDSGLKVYKNGLLLVPNRDYSENSEPGQVTSTKITLHGSVDAGGLLTFIAPMYG